MKIVDVAEFYAELGGGVRTYVNHKLAAAARAGHELVVIAPGPQDAEEARLGGRVRWVKGPRLPVDPRYFLLHREREVHRLLDLERPDVIEGSSTWLGGFIAARYQGPAKKALILHQDPVAVYPHTLLPRFVGEDRIDRACAPYWAFLRGLSRRFDTTVVAGQWLADRLARFGVDNATAVPFGIDTGDFGDVTPDPELRAQWLKKCGMPEAARLLVTVSRHHPEKRIPTVLQAFERAARKRPMGLLLLGDGPTRRLVEARAARIPGVHVAGFVDDRGLLVRTLASADGLLHGSAAETFGFAIAEAVYAGCPVIVPDRGGAAELAQPEYAERYRSGDPVEAAAAIDRLLSRDRELLRKQCLQVGRGRIHSVQEHFDQLFAHYGKLVAGRRGAPVGDSGVVPGHAEATV